MGHSKLVLKYGRKWSSSNNLVIIFTKKIFKRAKVKNLPKDFKKLSWFMAFKNDSEYQKCLCFHSKCLFSCKTWIFWTLFEDSTGKVTIIKTNFHWNFGYLRVKHEHRERIDFELRDKQIDFVFFTTLCMAEIQLRKMNRVPLLNKYYWNWGNLSRHEIP